MIIYLMLFCPFGIPIPLIFKVGFTNDFGTLFRRDAYLDKEVWWGCFVTVCFVVVPFAYSIEQFFHRHFSFLKVRFYKGSGSTETYFFPAAIPALVFMLLGWAVYWYALGRMFGFDGLDWYCDFWRGMWASVKDAKDLIQKLF